MTERDSHGLLHRKLGPGKLVIASHNKGKLREIGELLAPYGIDTVSAGALGVPEPEETGTSFVANAELKARFSADLTGLPALADDSGLCVEALGGEPGIFSARWAELEDGSRDFMEGMRRVHARMQEAGEGAGHDAHFVCALALAWPDGHIESFEGRVDGIITWPPRGNRGFGYDPIFQPLGHGISFGEMEPKAKHAMSHRADAFAKLVSAVF
ncbi:RdgB/HAM1 family non-canonical purine NTP pyrophosphatase [Rhizorhabdus dicambivorans]|uniref:dITP/XTP pyrophosphatase n=1 Tax=Rhizorhabdus dicambivorans TaxID=1850238 RepID=A0A2A4G1I1_9SPHN|nr:RdgB/HAM1 family non-canonical purine NTP pyrophosphatase [Rhizorhabdus dicambivorans]ATE65066.1 non-canonical purine NTP pyrophosphatase, RdgB/HAM1 family [Rhizorhabdus dicambivorans]PCE44341.1 non-canonical purine NTP pyrophosphatase, RdgB/HAM1 family [Rhizorhabdus dicambivorans]